MLIRSAALVCWIALFAAAGFGQSSTAPRITLQVDLTQAPRKLVHATETLAVVPGPLTLVFPKWIPGEHGPTGPIDDMAGFVILGRTASGQPCTTPPLPSPAGPAMATPDGRIQWQRDPVEMYAFHLSVPAGCARLEMALDFLATAAPVGFSASASTTENLAVLSWNTVVVSPAGVAPAALQVAPSVILPGGWRYGTALVSTTRPGEGDGKEAGPLETQPSGTPYTVAFQPVSLEQLIDSPVLTGRYFREVPLAPEVTPRHFIDIAADGPEQLALSSEHIAELGRLVREAGAMFGSRHYTSYHFLVTISDNTAHFGLEHHQSSDDRLPMRSLIEDDRFTLSGDLLPHEFTHSWNGKYRRPIGLATGNYESPMIGDMLWVYEGMTEYLAGVLATRSGIWSQEDYLGQLALDAATMDHWPGRSWRNLEDTARSAQFLYDAGGGWDNWRRGTDFYEEGELLWLDVDTTIRKLTNDKKSLNDFATAFFGPAGDHAPTVVPYTFEQLVAALNAVAPYDWSTFFHQRLDTWSAETPLVELENTGYRLTYSPNQTVWGSMLETQDTTVNFWFSLGLHLNSQDGIADVLRGSPADRAGLAPGMHLVAVNGRAFTPWLLRTAVQDAQGSGPAISLIVSNGDYFRVIAVDYHGGERYPMLERVAGTPDRLSPILQPLAR